MVRTLVPPRIKAVFKKSTPKFIVMLCDPSKRAFSDWKHAALWSTPMLKKHGSFKNFVEHYTKEINDLQTKLPYYSKEPLINASNPVELQTRHFFTNIDKRTGPKHHGLLTTLRHGRVPASAWEKMEKRQDYKPESLESFVNEGLDRKWQPFITFLTSGLYELMMVKWFKFFEPKQFLFLNGDDMILNPFDDLLKVEKFMGLKPFFQERHFVKKDKFYGHVIKIV